MVVQQPVMFAICALGAPVGILAQKKLIRRMGKVTKKEVLSFGNIVKTMRETAQGIRIVKAFTLEPAMRRADGRNRSRRSSASTTRWSR